MSAVAQPIVDLRRALIDPASSFGSPDDVVRNPQLTVSRKIEILCHWAYDTAELSVAEEEGMGGGESADMSAVLKALDEITDTHVHSSAPTKQAGFCVTEPHHAA